MLHMREQLLSAVKAHAQGEIAKHRANVNVYLEHPAGIVNTHILQKRFKWS